MNETQSQILKALKHKSLITAHAAESVKKVRRVAIAVSPEVKHVVKEVDVLVMDKRVLPSGRFVYPSFFWNKIMMVLL